MSTFFQNFPLIDYRFGDEINPALFQNISVYIDLIDQIVDDGSFYEKYTIQDGERPDTLSYKLYGTTDYYWTFFLLNEHIRQQGWPLTVQDLYTYSRLYYPNVVVATEDIDDFFRSFKRNDTVIQGNETTPSAKGIILERNLDLGQLTIKPVIEVRSISMTNIGAGYTSVPDVTITGGGGTGALAAAVLSDSGVVRSITVTDGGLDYVTTPTIVIEDPEPVNWSQVAATTLDVVNGVITSGPYFNFLATVINGFQYGDVNFNGEVDTSDAELFRLYGTNVAALTETQFNRIKNTVRPAIINSHATLPAWSKGPGTKATAVASLSSNTFTNLQLLYTVTGVPNNKQWSIGDREQIFLRQVVDQVDGVHHFEDSSGRWVDIDPFDFESRLGRIPITYFERLQQANDSLKEIKILKPDVAVQVFSEFQNILRNER